MYVFLSPKTRLSKLVSVLAVILLALQSLVFCPVQAAPLPLQDDTGLEDPAELEAFADGVMNALMKRDHVPGAVLVVVKDGSPFFSKGYGYADVENRIPVDPEQTLFRPGSVSKLFTWTAVMQLVEHGKISLDEDVNTYIDYIIPNTFPEPVTMSHLMTHTPGFEDVGQDLFKLDEENVQTLEEYLKARLPERVFPPGEIGAYSNYGTALAGYIVQRISGMPFEVYVQQNILEPLGMQNSTFQQPLPESLASNMSKGYNFQGGEYVEGGFEFVVGTPAGALSATGADMARFMIAHLQNGQIDGTRILAEETAVQMHEQLFTPDPRFEGMAHGFFRSMVNEKLILSHGGDTFLFHTNMFLIPEDNVGVFISTNGTTGALTAAGMTDAFMDKYYPVEVQGPAQQPSGFQERIGPFLGEYYLARSNFTTFEKVVSILSPVRINMNQEGNLQVSLPGEVSQYVEVEPGLLQDRLEPDNRLLFLAGDEGQHYLIPPVPFTFIKSPWYGTTSFQGLLLIFSLVLFLIAVVRWPITSIVNRKPGERQSAGARSARWLGFLASLVGLVFIIWFILIMLDVHPAYGVPNIFFQNPPGFNILIILPMILAVLSLGMLIFLVIAWVRKYWSVSGRIFYTLLTLAVFVFVWQMVYWNLLF
ncbi:MAG: class A beta-lactamase-related serine hydrolase [Chloroflexi bacterium]|nr:MAG: class A beta-lactamase-related serine hydrolase [Chloroflexota bacterium]